MADSSPKFTVVPDKDEEDHLRPPRRDVATDAGTHLLLLGLQTVGKRFVSALADLFCLLTVASAFFLWHAISDPNVLQVVSLTIYAVFVLCINWIVRR